jgi:hypothetical protein
MRPINDKVSSEKLALKRLDGIRGGIPFPLELTCPLALSPHEDFKSNSWIAKNRGVVFTEAFEIAAPNYMRIEASLMQEAVTDGQTKKEDIKYYSLESKTLCTEEQSGTIPVSTSQIETQIWDDPNDWLWLESHRTDKDGNIVLRCRKMGTASKCVPEKDYPEQ